MIEMNYIGTMLDEPIVLDNGKYNGYNYWILSYGSHPCGYVEIPKKHPYYGKCDCDAFDLPIDVHGGITYGDYGLHKLVGNDKFLIGWDYNHCYDYSSFNILQTDGKRWTTKEVIEDVKSVIQQLCEVKESK